MKCPANKFILLVSIFIANLVLANQPAYAQYWGLGSGLGYGYYGLGSSLLWPLFYLGHRSLSSSLYSSPYLPYNGAYYNPNNNFFNNTYAYKLSPQPNYSYQQTPQGINNPNDVFNENNGLPPAAPDRHTVNQAGNTSENPAVLNGFFQAVSTHYHNDLFRALHQPDMHAWAESIGLININQALPNHFNKARQNEILTVLKDNSLDPNAKLQLLRLLLK